MSHGTALELFALCDINPAVAIRQAIDSTVPVHLVRQAIATAGRLGRVLRPELAGLRERLEERGWVWTS